MKGPVELISNQEMNSQNGSNSMPQEQGRVDFSEYMWMAEDLEEFDRKVEEELLEQEFIEQCFEEMLEEEEEAAQYFGGAAPRGAAPQQQQQQQQQQQPQGGVAGISQSMQEMNMNAYNQAFHSVETSRLNPNAPEFVPRSLPVAEPR